jgi:TPR repeat protein
LLSSSRTSFGLKPPDRAAMQDEALKWIILAANQGDAQGQADMAQLCLNGELVKQDYVEAYKWGELCSERLALIFLPVFKVVLPATRRS